LYIVVREKTKEKKSDIEKKKKGKTISDLVFNML